jgi:hypothetical protein
VQRDGFVLDTLFTCSLWKGSVRIEVRRATAVHDTMRAFGMLAADDLQKFFRIEFHRGKLLPSRSRLCNHPSPCVEEGIDAGGLLKEWINVVSSQIFDPSLG